MRLRFNHILLNYIFPALTAVVVALLTASCAESPVDAPEPPAAPGVSIRLTTGSMLPQVVTSRAADAEEKTTDEQKINTVHIFFFDAEGNFLTPTKPEEFAPYVALDFTTGRPEALAVPSDAFEGQDAAAVHIVAVANIEGSRFLTDWTPDGDIVSGDPDDSSKKVKVSSVDDLYRWVYRPAEQREDISKLPKEGMPMVGELNDARLTGTSTIDVHLKALMARVDVKIKLNALQINAEEGLPKLVVNGFGIKNLPKKVSLFNFYDARTVTADDEIITDEQIVEVSNPVTLTTNENEQTFTYYTYENLRDANTEGFSYPEGVADDPAVRQRWKPMLADAHASALVIHGDYTTHQNLTYRAQFTFYLGDNTVDNFEVRRNRCYKNDITVCGLDIVGNHDDNLYTFDARVNVATDNPVFISLVNERRIDSHWSVVPMDIYFLDNAPEGATVDVEILKPADDWIHLDYCDASTVAPEDIKAGWGCSDYFYEDMFTRYPATSATAHHNRDRIYFYVDENASTSSREAHIKITYNPGDGGEIRTQTIEFLQAGLIEFKVGDNTYYMEAYEEYDEHRDPLDTHAPSPWYQPAGIPWARTGTVLANRALGTEEGDWWDLNRKWTPNNLVTVEADGKTMTEYILGLQYETESRRQGLESIATDKIYSSVTSAGAVYEAAGKNKRSSDGLVKEVKWFLPGIVVLESMVANNTLRILEPRFTTSLYWSANPARNPNYVRIVALSNVGRRENPVRAKATMYKNGSVVPSEKSGGMDGIDPALAGATYPHNSNDNDCQKDNVYTDCDYEYGYGRTFRTQTLRVRAIRVADDVKTN